MGRRLFSSLKVSRPEVSGKSPKMAIRHSVGRHHGPWITLKKIDIRHKNKVDIWFIFKYLLYFFQTQNPTPSPCGILRPHGEGLEITRLEKKILNKDKYPTLFLCLMAIFGLFPDTSGRETFNDENNLLPIIDINYD